MLHNIIKQNTTSAYSQQPTRYVSKLHANVPDGPLGRTLNRIIMKHTYSFCASGSFSSPPLPGRHACAVPCFIFHVYAGVISHRLHGAGPSLRPRGASQGTAVVSSGCVVCVLSGAHGGGRVNSNARKIPWERDGGQGVYTDSNTNKTKPKPTQALTRGFFCENALFFQPTLSYRRV